MVDVVSIFFEKISFFNYVNIKTILVLFLLGNPGLPGFTGDPGRSGPKGQRGRAGPQGDLGQRGSLLITIVSSQIF